MADAIVKIGGDTSAFTGALDRARQQATSWGKGIAGTLTSSLAGIFAGAAIANELREIVHEFANIEDIASRSDVGIEFLLSIKQQAQDTGTSLEEAAKAVKKFTIAANDSTSGAAMSGVLRSLGTSLEQVRAMNGEELFATLAKAVGSVSTQAERLQVLNVLLGDAGGRMESLLPLLQDVARNGVAPVSEEMVKATKDAAELEDRLSRLYGQIKSFVLPVFLGFLNILEAVGYTIAKVSFVIPFESLKGTAEAATNAVKSLWEAMKLNPAGMTLFASKAADGIKNVFDNATGQLKKTVNEAEVLVDKAFGGVDAGKVVDPIEAANKALQEQLRLQRELADATAKKANEEKAFQAQVQSMKDRNAALRSQESLDKAKKAIQDAKDAADKRQADLDQHRANLVKEIAANEEKIKQLTGASSAPQNTLASVGEKLKEIASQKKEGQQAVVSSRTAMGLGGGSSALTVDPRRLEKLQEDQLTIQKEIKAEIESLRETADGLASDLNES